MKQDEDSDQNNKYKLIQVDPDLAKNAQLTKLDKFCQNYAPESF